MPVPKDFNQHLEQTLLQVAKDKQQVLKKKTQDANTTVIEGNIRIQDATKKLEAVVEESKKNPA